MRDKRQLRNEQRDLERGKLDLEMRMRKFRKVQELAWDAVIALKHTGVPQIRELEKQLHATDRLWEGWAGCARLTNESKDLGMIQ